LSLKTQVLQMMTSAPPRAPPGHPAAAPQQLPQLPAEERSAAADCKPRDRKPRDPRLVTGRPQR
jgi:hypothetical protein